MPLSVISLLLVSCSRWILFFFKNDVQSVLSGIISEYFCACLFEMVPDQLFVVFFKQIKLRESTVPE